MGEGTITLVGILERVRYSKPETGFMIGSFIEENSLTPITIKGKVFQVQDKQMLRLKGRWENHAKYGKQFAVSEFMPIDPTTCVGIRRYLASGVFPGIGEKTAERIVTMFGNRTFEVIDKEPEKLMKVNRFTRKQLKTVKEGRDEHHGYREVMTFLHGLGISNAYAARIYADFGLNSIPEIKLNPYILTKKLRGIGFIKADSYARRIGFDENSPKRATAAIDHMLDQLENNGHTCFPRQELVEKTVEELHIHNEVVESALKHLIEDRLIKIFEEEKGENDTLEMVSRPRFFYAEQRLIENLHRLLNTDSFTQVNAESELIAAQEKKLGIELDPVQHQAIHGALQNKVMIITGGPGTGKTTLVRFILGIMSRKIPSKALAAPTGRAAKRLTETTGEQASTIHRLLEFGHKDNLNEDGYQEEENAIRTSFQRNRDNPLEAELLVIDETSMIDTVLMDALLEAIHSTARLVLVGDVDQLPSVGAGTVLRDLIESETIPVIRLERIFRHSKGNDSLIISNAHNVRLGIMPKLPKTNSSEILQDFYFIPTDKFKTWHGKSDQDLIVELIKKLVSKRIPERFGFDPFSEIQVLTPMHGSPTGTKNLNKELQTLLNAKGASFEHRDQLLRVGDKVMQQHNDYKKKIFNGDMGLIRACDPKTREVHVEFDQDIVRYENKDLDQLSLAYAISVHKSQGSEYPAVILPLTTQHFLMLQRNLLYTALTRGKRLVILIGTEKAVGIAVNNKKALTRHTSLPSKFREFNELMFK